MNRLLSRGLIALVLTWLTAYSTPSPAQAQFLGLHGTAPGAGVCALDGHLAAPVGGATLHAFARSEVAFAPPCLYPDVDYPVGPPAGITYKDPRTQPPANTDPYYPPQNTVACFQAGCVWDGYDFTLNGGTNILIGAGATDWVIKNSKFAKGVNCINGPKSLSAAVNGTLIYNDFDGGGITTQNACKAAGIDNGELVQILNAGTKVIQYNRFHDFDQHDITVGGLGSLDFRYNAIYNCGFEDGAHCNLMQFSDTNSNSQVYQWNFTYDPQPSIPATYVTSCTAGQNVLHVIVNSNQGSFRTGTQITSPCITGTATITNVNDPTVNQQQFPNGPDPVDLTTDHTNTSTQTSVTSTVLNQWPLGGVIGVRYQYEGGGASTFGNIDVSRNWFAGPGPIKGITSYIYCSTTAGSFTANGNYWSPQNATALFNLTTSPPNQPVDVCHGPHLGSGNKRTDDGTETPVPQ